VKVSNKMASNSKAISLNDIVLNGIMRVIEKRDTNMWAGTMTELNSALVKTLNNKQSDMLPGSPGALRIVVNRIVNRLRSRGISVRFARTTDHVRTRYVRFTR
jgi:hypothetical protein